VKICILVNHDIYANSLLNQLLPQLQGHQVWCFYSQRVGKLREKPAPLEYLAFFEQSLFNHKVCPWLDTKAQALGMRSWAGLSQWLQTPAGAIGDINDAQSLQQLSAIGPDLILSVRFGQILKSNVLAIPKHGAINLHSGLLPSYRGVMATFWSMFNGEADYGCTLHRITDEQIDRGEWLDELRLPLDLHRDYFSNTLALYQPGANLLLQAVKAIASGRKLVAQHQCDKRGRYYTYPTMAQLEKWLSKGFQLIDRSAYQNHLQRQYRIPRQTIDDWLRDADE